MILPTYVVSDRPGGRPDRLLVLLHGYDATEHDFTALGPLLDPDGHFLIAGPRGPVDLPDGAWAWFEHGPMGPDRGEVEDTLDQLDVTLDELCREHLMGRDEVVIGGFSQGAATALALALRPGGGVRPAGVVALSGFLPDVMGFEYRWDVAPDIPVLMQHGTHDETVPIELARDAADLLVHHGGQVAFEQYEMAHQTTVESLAAARDWLTGIHPS